MTTSFETRVSCGALIKLTDDQGRFAVLGSQSTYEATGERRLSPIGGAIEATDAGIDHLVARFEVNRKSFESGNDLRFRMGTSHIDDFRLWLNSGAGTEEHPARREFKEEMGPDEHQLLTPEEARACTFEFYQQFEQPTRRSVRRGQEGVQTYCFFDFYTAEVPLSVLMKLQTASEHDGNLFEFVTEQEIVMGVSSRGSTISDLCLLLRQ